MSTDTIRKIMQDLSDRNSGVYRRPWRHQQESLRLFYQNRDLFITTGTGSDKTECFLWPTVSRLIHEVTFTPETWAILGIRVILLHPMNTLVSDQIGRLRKILGNTQFYDYFTRTTTGKRISQFGMYTGRTPYAGVHTQTQDKQVAQSLGKNLLPRNESIRNQLKWENIRENTI